MLILVTLHSKAHVIIAHLNTGFMVLNHAENVNVCVSYSSTIASLGII
jgi:hypothetical protein